MNFFFLKKMVFAYFREREYSKTLLPAVVAERQKVIEKKKIILFLKILPI